MATKIYDNKVIFSEEDLNLTLLEKLKIVRELTVKSNKVSFYFEHNEKYDPAKLAEVNTMGFIAYKSNQVLEVKFLAASNALDTLTDKAIAKFLTATTEELKQPLLYKSVHFNRNIGMDEALSLVTAAHKDAELKEKMKENKTLMKEQDSFIKNHND